MQFDRTLVNTIRLARGLEMAGFYNAAKVLWAIVYSEELKASNHVSVPTSVADLERELGSLIPELKSDGIRPDLIAMLEKAHGAVAKEAAIPYTDIPAIHVCRTCGEIVTGNAPDSCPNCGAWELTFRTFPAVHYLEPLPPAEALEKLETIPNLLDGMLKDVSDDRLEIPPAPGEWNLRQVMAHFLTTQELLASRVTRMLTNDNPELKAMTAAELSNPESMTGRQMFDSWKASRLKTVAELKAAAPNGWWRTGIHQEFGTVTVLQQASYFAKHDHNHLTQIRVTIKAIS